MDARLPLLAALLLVLGLLAEPALAQVTTGSIR